MKFGLSDAICAELQRVVAAHPGVDAVIFGSRARGDYRPGSDIDLALDAPQHDAAMFARLCRELESVPMIFRLDIVRRDTLRNPALAAHIARDGVPLAAVAD